MNFLSSRIHRWTLTLAVLCLASIALAQEQRGLIAGRVTDSSGAALPSVSVTATETATNVATRATSNAVGEYRLLYLQPGKYVVTAELAGFKKLSRSNIVVRIADRITIDLQLEPGDVTEMIEVVANASPLDSGTANLGQIIDGERIARLPLRDGNPFLLTVQTPGTMFFGGLKDTRPFDNGATSSIATAGIEGKSTEFTLDGAPDTGRGQNVAYVPPVDAVAEFKVETAAYDAQYGHASGATVNVSMKGGTNALHGSAYYFLRPESLAANDFFSNRAGKPRAEMNYDRFGGSLGGPIAKDKTHFFVAYERIAQEIPEPTTRTVPTLAMRNGDFSALLSQGIVIYDPATAFLNADGRVERQPFPGNIIPADRIDSIAQNVLGYWPTPNQAGDAEGRNNYFSPNPQNDNYWTITGRIDHSYSSRHRGSLRFSYGDRNQSRNNWSGEVNGVRATGWNLYRRPYSALYDHVYMHSASTALNVKVGYLRYEEPYVRMHQDVFDPRTLGFSATTQSYFGPQLYFPDIEIDGFGNIGESYGDERITVGYSIQPTLTKILGRHTLRMGYDGRLHQFTRNMSVHAAGRYRFRTNFTRGPIDSSAGQFGQGLASLLLGLPEGRYIDRGRQVENQNYHHAIFIQDDWKVGGKLTLNLGIRYELETPSTERYNRNVRTFDTDIASPIGAQAEANYAQNPIPEVPVSDFRVQGGLTFLDDSNPGRWEMDKNNIQPRVGFAYQLDRKTVVRGGWGIFTAPFYPEEYNQAGFDLRTNIVPTLDNGLTFQATLANPWPNGVMEPAGASAGAGTFMGQSAGNTIPAGVRNASQNMRWSIGFQRELPGHWVVEANYVGSQGYDLPVRVARTTTSDSNDPWQPNYVPREYLSTSPTRDQVAIDFLSKKVANPMAGLLPGTGLDGSTVKRSQLLFDFPQFSNINSELRDGTSSYHSAQFRLEKRFSSGYSVMLAYTYSRAKVKTIYLNRTDAGPTEFLARDADTPHSILASFICELPFGEGKKWDLGRVGNVILGGWSINGMFMHASGRPIRFGNLYYNGDPTQLKSDYSDIDAVWDTSGFYHPDSEPGKERSDSRIRLQDNVRTFPYVPGGIRRDHITNLDLSVIKRFKLGRGVGLDLRVEAINAFNHVVFDKPSTNPTSSNFAKVTQQANLPRTIQFASKLIF